MSDVVQRLRASKLRGNTASYQAGWSVGLRWAETQAEAWQLQNLDVLYDQLSGSNPDWDEHFSADTSLVFGGGFPWWLTHRILSNPNQELEPKGFREFWHGLTGNRWDAVVEDKGFLKGFCEASLDVWWRVRDQL